MVGKVSRNRCVASPITGIRGLLGASGRTVGVKGGFSATSAADSNGVNVGVDVRAGVGVYVAIGVLVTVGV